MTPVAVCLPPPHTAAGVNIFVGAVDSPVDVVAWHGGVVVTIHAGEFSVVTSNGAAWFHNVGLGTDTDHDTTTP